MSSDLPATFSGVPSLETYAENLQVKLQFCELLLKSGFCPAHYKTAASVLAAILMGQELGFSPMQSLQSIVVIQGKPTIDAQGMKAKIYEAGGRIKEIEWTAEKCILEGDRGGHIQRAEYTLKDAQLAGLVSKDNWKKHPKAMLYARAISMIARNQWADVIKGLGYTPEEMADAVPSGESKAQAVIEATADTLEPLATDHDPDEIMGFGKGLKVTWRDCPQAYLSWLFRAGAVKWGEARAFRAGLELERRHDEAKPADNGIDDDDLPWNKETNI